MDQTVKQRLVGAAVLVALGVIFIPILLDSGPVDDAPVIQHEFPDSANVNSAVVPVDEEQLAALREASEAGVDELRAGGGLAANDESAAGNDAPRTGVTAWVVQMGSFA